MACHCGPHPAIAAAMTPAKAASLAQDCRQVGTPVYENLGRRTLPPSQIAAHVWPAFLSGGGRNRGRGQSAFPRRRSRGAISTIYMARGRVICGNTMFRRRRLRIRGPRGVLMEERPGNRLPCRNRIWAVGPTGKRHVWALNLTFSLCADPHPDPLQYPARTPELAPSSPIRELSL